HVHQRSGPAAPFVDVLGEQLLACSRRADQEDWKRRSGVALRQHERPPDGRGDADDHRSTPFGNRGAVTLSASASVLRMRGVRNKYSSVALLVRLALPNRPPRIGRCDSTGIPVWLGAGWLFPRAPWHSRRASRHHT